MKFAKFAHYALMHAYALLGLLMGAYFLSDTIEYQIAMYNLLKTQTKMLIFIASKLNGMST